jgi:hypothetical protein
MGWGEDCLRIHTDTKNPADFAFRKPRVSAAIWMHIRPFYNHLFYVWSLGMLTPHIEEACLRTSEPSIQYDRTTKQLTVTLNGKKHKLGSYGDPVTARRAADAFIAERQTGKPKQ